MADFDMEQMRIIFQNLADKLANTKGDDNIVEKLKVVEKAIRNLEKKQGSQAQKSKADQKRENQEFIKEFVKEFDNASVLKDIHQTLKDQGLNNSGPGQGALNLDPKDFSKLSSKIGGSLLAFGKLTSAMGNGAASLVNNFGNLNGSFSGLARAAGITTGAIATMAAVLDERADAYRTLVSTAEGTIGSLQDLGHAMHVSTLSATEFADAIAKGTQGTRLMGAQPWAQLYRSILDQTKSMGFYGYSTQQLVAAQNEYLDMLANRGDLFNRTDQQIVDGLQNLLVVNDKMATILGKTREEQLAAAAEQARDPNFSTYMQGLGDNVDKDIINQLMGSLNSISPALKNIGQDMMMMNGGVTGEAAKVAAVLPPEVRNIILSAVEQAKQGNLNADELKDAIQSLRAPMQSFIKNNAQTLGILGKQVGEQFQTINEIGVNTSKIKQDENITAEGTKQTDAGTVAVLQANQAIREMGAAVRDTVTGVLNPLLNNFGPELQTLVGGTSDLVNKFRETIIQLENFDGAISAIAAVFAGGAIINAASGIVGTLVAARMVPMIGEAVKVITSPLKGLAGGMWNLGKILTGGALAKSIASSVANAVSKIPGLGGGNTASRLGRGALALGGVASAVSLVASIPDNEEDLKKFMEENAKATKETDEWLHSTIGDPRSWLYSAMGWKDDRYNEDGTQSGVLTGNPKDTKPNGTVTPEETDEKVDNKVQGEQIQQAVEAANVEKTETVDPNMAALSDLTKSFDKQVAATTPVDPVTQPMMTEQLDVQSLMTALNSDSTAVQSTISATNAALERIYQILKQNLDFDKESSQIIRDRLTELQRLNEDLVRVGRR